MTQTGKPQPLRKQGHPRALAARARKREEAGVIGVDDAYVGAFVDAFYDRIRMDDMLGPIFAERISNWDPHLARMKAFWRSVLFNSGEYSGNPMRMHLAIPGLEERHFAHWLELFYATLRDLEQNPAATREVGDRARMIATSLLLGVASRGGNLPAGTVGQTLPHVSG